MDFLCERGVRGEEKRGIKEGKMGIGGRRCEGEMGRGCRREFMIFDFRGRSWMKGCDFK